MFHVDIVVLGDFEREDFEVTFGKVHSTSWTD